MRRLLAIACVVVVLAGAAMVAPGGMAAQEPVGEAELEYACTPAGAAIGEDTLLRCTATATNTGSETLANAALQFAPASDVAIPDRYYFFRYRLNGEERAASGGTLSFSFGDIAPGESSTIDLEIIVRVTRPSGAVVQLASFPPGGFQIHVQRQVQIEALAGGVAALVMRIAPVTPDGPDGVVTGPLNVVLENNTGAPAGGVAVEVAWDEGVRLVADSAGTWEIDEAARRARATVNAPSGTSVLPLEFAPDGSECGFVTTAGTATWDGATAAAIADFGYQVGECPAFGQGGGGDGDVVSPPGAADSVEGPETGRLRAPDTGAGTGRGAASWWPLAAVAGAMGLATSLGGAALRRHRR